MKSSLHALNLALRRSARRPLSLLLAALIVLAIFFIRFTFTPGPSASQAQSSSISATPAPRAPIIVQLVGRDHTIAISKHPDGLRYSIIDPHGNTILDQLTEDQLADQRPDIHIQLENLLDAGRATISFTNPDSLTSPR